MNNCLKLLSFFLITLSAFAAIDFSQYKLTEVQRNLLESMQKKDKYTEEKLIGIAETFERINAKEEQRSEYIPPHDAQLLVDVDQWAKGGAFSAFSSYADVKFLADPYKADCPSWAVFNFGRATGVEFLRVDILRGAINISSELQHNFAKDPENFKDRYLKIAKREGFLKYLEY